MLALHSLILDCLFPIQCLGCHAWDIWICEACLQKNLDPQRKTIEKQNLDGIFSLGIYKNPLLEKSIKTLKYRFVRDIGNVLGKEMALHIPFQFDMIASVPLHFKRFRERGFNQSEGIGKVISRKLEIPYSNLLTKNTATLPQAELSGKLRRKNLNAVFVSSTEASEKNILLVDDVVTTGTTLEACARALKEKNARTVWGGIIARD